jgi:hypothetical protein
MLDKGIITYSVLFERLGDVHILNDHITINSEHDKVDVILGARLSSGDVIALEDCTLEEHGIRQAAIIEVSSEEA